MKKNSIILILVILSFELSAQFKYGKSLYHIPFETPIGCPAELQSNNPNFDSTKLRLIIPLLANFPSEDKGYYNKFGHISIFPYSQKFNRKEEYIEFAEDRYLQIQANTNQLSELNFPVEFDTLRKVHLNNRGVRMEFATILLDWMKHGDDELFCQNALAINNDSEVSELLISIFMEESWEEKFLRLSVRMGNLFNRLNKDRIISDRAIQKRLFEQNKIAIIQEPNCRD